MNFIQCKQLPYTNTRKFYSNPDSNGNPIVRLAPLGESPIQNLIVKKNNFTGVFKNNITLYFIGIVNIYTSGKGRKFLEKIFYLGYFLLIVYDFTLSIFCKILYTGEIIIFRRYLELTE